MNAPVYKFVYNLNNNRVGRKMYDTKIEKGVIASIADAKLGSHHRCMHAPDGEQWGHIIE